MDELKFQTRLKLAGIMRTEALWLPFSVALALPASSSLES